MKIKELVVVLVISILGLSGCIKKNASPTTSTVNKPTTTNIPTTEIYLGQQTDQVEKKEKLCGWIDKSDIIIELSFADGVNKDTSYETGFYYSPIMSNMRLARNGCDYRTGFSFEEMKNKGAVEVGARGYTDNKRRKLDGEPHSVTFDENGKPNVPLPIRVKVMD